MGPNSDPGSQPLTGSVFGGHTPLFSTSLLVNPLVLFHVVGLLSSFQTGDGELLESLS